MDERVARTIGTLSSLKELKQLEVNLRKSDALDDATESALRVRGAFLCRKEVAEKTSLTLERLSPAEEKIVRAVSEYVSIKKRQGSQATRTLMQLRNRGLLGAAEQSVCKSKPTQGFITLNDANLEDLSYEQIVVDHPTEFSARALWYSRRALGLPNETIRPPV